MNETYNGKIGSIELQACEMVIELAICAGATEEQIAKTYAMARQSSWPTDWHRVNLAIRDAHGWDGLQLVKNMAEKIVNPTPDQETMAAHLMDLRAAEATMESAWGYIRSSHPEDKATPTLALLHASLVALRGAIQELSTTEEPDGK